MRNYDAWLEKPYDDDAQERARFEQYWDEYGIDMEHAVRDSVLQDAPYGDLRYVRDHFAASLADLSEQVVIRWAHHLEPHRFPLYEDWKDDQD